MANNSALTVATDDAAGVHYQYVKLADGTEDSTAIIPGDATNGLYVNVTKLVPGTGATNIGKVEDGAHTTGDVGVMALAVRAAAATDRSAGATDGDYEPLAVDALGQLWTHEVGQFGKFAVTPTVDTAAYGANDIVGGIQTIANWARISGGGAKLKALSVYTADGEVFEFSILFFSATPAGGTYADNGAVTWAAGDAALYLGKVTVATANYVTLGGDSMATVSCDLPLNIAATSLFALIFATATPTFAAATDLHLMLLCEY